VLVRDWEKDLPGIGRNIRVLGIDFQIGKPGTKLSSCACEYIDKSALSFLAHANTGDPNSPVEAFPVMSSLAR